MMSKDEFVEAVKGRVDTETTELANAQFFDKDGNSLTLLEWAELFGDMDYRSIKRNEFGTLGETPYVVVSTVWLGFDSTTSMMRSVLAGKDWQPCIYETMVFADDPNGELNWVEMFPPAADVVVTPGNPYSSASALDALETHARMVTRLCFRLPESVIEATDAGELMKVEGV
jgi:hypothetical protein